MDNYVKNVIYNKFYRSIWKEKRCEYYKKCMEKHVKEVGTTGE